MCVFVSGIGTKGADILSPVAERTADNIQRVSVSTQTWESLLILTDFACVQTSPDVQSKGTGDFDLFVQAWR